MESRKTAKTNVFTSNSVVDGSWVRVLNMAEAEVVPLSVIVVGDHPDTRHYLSMMQCGGFDFVVPPFEHEPLNFVVRGAALDAHRRREGTAVSAVTQ